MSENNVELFEAWATAARALNEAKQAEVALRNKIAAMVLGDKVEGSKTAVISGWKFTAQGVLNYNLDRSYAMEIWDELSDEETSCLEWKLELKVPAYRKLPSDSKLRKAVTVKPGQAQLAIKE